MNKRTKAAATDYATDEAVRGMRDANIGLEPGMSLAAMAQAGNVSPRPRRAKTAQRTIEAMGEPSRKTYPDAHPTITCAVQSMAVACRMGLVSRREIEAGVSLARFAELLEAAKDRALNTRGRLRQSGAVRKAAERMKAAKAAAARGVAAGNATPETVAKCRRDQVLGWLERGHLSRAQATAAEEIRDIWETIARQGGPSVSNPGGQGGGKGARLVMDPVLGQPSSPTAIQTMKPKMRARYRKAYLPWAESLRVEPVTRSGGANKRDIVHTEALAMTISLVIDNHSVTVLEEVYGLPVRAKVAQLVIRSALQRYVDISGLEGRLSR